MMKKVVWLCILLAVVGTAFVSADSNSTIVAVSKDGNVAASGSTSRNLKEGGISSGSEEDGGGGGGGGVSLDDYLPVDPSPSSKALIPRPIEHGTPLIPYIPKPSPPKTTLD